MSAVSAGATSLAETSSDEPSRAGDKAPPTWLVVAAFAAVYLIWGSTYLGIHVAITTIPPFIMAGARFVIAGVLLFAAMRMRGVPMPALAQWIDASWIGGLLLLGGNGGVSWAQQTVPSSIAALVVAAVPLWMNLIDWLRPGGVRPRSAVFMGLAIGFAGVALIVLGKDQHGNRVVNPIGAGVLLFSTLSWAFGSVFSRHARKPAAPLMAVAMQMICGGALLFLAGAGFGELARFHFSQVSTASWNAFIYLTLVGSLVGFTAYVWLLQVSTPARVSTYAYVNPLIAVLLGRWILEEPLPKSVLLAGALILLAVIAITRAKSRPTNA